MPEISEFLPKEFGVSLLWLNLVGLAERDHPVKASRFPDLFDIQPGQSITVMRPGQQLFFRQSKVKRSSFAGKGVILSI